MDAAPLLATIAEALEAVGLEAVLVGNAAAALRGAPVTTLDFDFMFRKTPANVAKLKRLARRFNAVILCPYCPVSDLYRAVAEDTGLQLDFMSLLHGIRSFASLRSRAAHVAFGRARLLVASLDDIGAAGDIDPQPLRHSERSEAKSRNLFSPGSRAERCLDKLGMTREGSSAHRGECRRVKRGPRRGERLKRLTAECEKAEVEQIRRLLALPIEKRTHFLRRRTGFTGSAL